MNEFPGEDTIYIGDGGDVVTISAQAVRPRNPGALVSLGQKGARKGRREHITCSQLYPGGFALHAPDAVTQTMDT